MKGQNKGSLEYHISSGGVAPLSSQGQTRAWAWKKESEGTETKEPLKPAWRKGGKCTQS